MKDLFPNGHIPRRAVLVDGLIVERTSQQQKEITNLSLVCEAIKTQCGEPIYSRDCLELLRTCLDGVDAVAWTILHSDLILGDCLSWPKYHEYVQHHSYVVTRIIKAPTQAHNIQHLIIVMKVLFILVSHLPTEALPAAASTMLQEAKALISVFSTHCRMMRSEARDEVLGSLGKLLLLTNKEPTPELTLLFRQSLNNDDVLRFFVYAPIGEDAREDPEVIKTLLFKAKRVPPAARHTLLTLLMRCTVPSVPEMHGDIAALTLDTLKASDVRLVYVSTRLLHMTATTQELKLMGNALERVCLQLMAKTS